MADTIDLLKLKIEKAKESLPQATLEAIDATNWPAAILQMRETKGYSFEQLGDLEIETELLLCGLVSPDQYPKELETRMGISKAAANDLVNEMNDLVFKRIREELIKNTERERVFGNKNIEVKSEKINDVVAKKEMLPIPGRPTVPKAELMQVGKLELETTKRPAEVHPMLAQKLSAPTQTPTIKTEHTLENISKPVATAPKSDLKTSNTDPYREIPE